MYKKILIGILLLAGCFLAGCNKVEDKLDTGILIGWQYTTYCTSGKTCENDWDNQILYGVKVNCCEYLYGTTTDSLEYVMIYNKASYHDDAYSNAVALIAAGANGYSECQVKTYEDVTSNGDSEGRTTVICKNCPSNMVKVLQGANHYHYQTCVLKECSAGNTSSTICGDGSSIISKTCNNSIWAPTNNVCCDTESAVKYCEKDGSIVEFRCELGDWSRVNTCPSPPPPPPPGDLILGYSLIGATALLTGCGAWLLMRKKK